MNKKKFLTALMVAGIFIYSPVNLNFNAENFQINSIAHAEIKTYIGEDTAMLDFGDDDNKIVNTVKNVAKMRAIKAAQSKAGVYIKSFSQMSNGVLTKDDILVITNNISEILNVEYEKLWFQAEDVKGNSYNKSGYMYKATATVNIDTDGISEYINRSAREKFKLIEQNRNLRESIVEIDANFEEIRKNTENKTPEEFKSEIEKLDNEILIEQKIDEGNKCLYQKDYSAAILKYDEALKLNPNNSHAKNNIESIYDERKNLDRLIRDFDKSIQNNPKDATAYYNRGNSYERLGDYSLQNNFTSVEERSESYLKEIKYNYDKKNYNFALKDYNKAIKLNPNDANFYNARGQTFTNLKNYKNATADFNTAIKIKKNYAEAYNNRGETYCRFINSKKRNDRLGNLITGIFSLPADVFSDNPTSYITENKPDYQPALKDFEKAIRLNPEYAKAYYNHGKVYSWMENYNQTIEDYSKAIQLDPLNTWYYKERGYIYCNKLNNYAQAISDYKKCIEIEPYESEHYHSLINLYEKVGLHQEAQELQNQYTAKLQQARGN